MILVVFWLVGQIRNDNKKFQFIGKTPVRDTISVNGEGKVVGLPDVALASVGLLTENKDVVKAQTENTNKMNALINKIKGFDVDSKDIQTTNYSISPRYDWPDGKQVLRGYQVSQSLQLKIRDLGKIGAILSAAGEAGANQVSGVSFTIDDPEKLRQEARSKAMDNALIKAQALAEKGKVKLGKLVGYYEDNAPPSYAKAYEGYGMGGGPTMMNAPAPTVETGSLDVIVDVTLTYEIL